MSAADDAINVALGRPVAARTPVVRRPRVPGLPDDTKEESPADRAIAQATGGRGREDLPPGYLARFGGAVADVAETVGSYIPSPIKAALQAPGAATGALVGQLYDPEAYWRAFDQSAAGIRKNPDDFTTSEQIRSAPGVGSVLRESFSPRQEGERGFLSAAKDVGALGLDILTDPSTYLGGGLSKAGRLGKAAFTGERALLDAPEVSRVAQGIDAASEAVKEAQRLKAMSRPGLALEAASRVVGSPVAGAVYAPELIQGVGRGLEDEDWWQVALQGGLAGLMAHGARGEFGGAPRADVPSVDAERPVRNFTQDRLPDAAPFPEAGEPTAFGPSPYPVPTPELPPTARIQPEAPFSSPDRAPFPESASEPRQPIVNESAPFPEEAQFAAMLEARAKARAAQKAAEVAPIAPPEPVPAVPKTPTEPTLDELISRAEDPKPAPVENPDVLAAEKEIAADMEVATQAGPTEGKGKGPRLGDLKFVPEPERPGVWARIKNAVRAFEADPNASMERSLEEVTRDAPPELRRQLRDEWLSLRRTRDEGHGYLRELRQFFPAEGPEGARVEHESPADPKGTYYVVQRARNPQTGQMEIVGGGLTRKGKRAWIVGGTRVMDSYVSVSPVYDLMGAESETLTSGGWSAQDRRREQISLRDGVKEPTFEANATGSQGVDGPNSVAVRPEGATGAGPRGAEVLDEARPGDGPGGRGVPQDRLGPGLGASPDDVGRRPQAELAPPGPKFATSEKPKPAFYSQLQRVAEDPKSPGAASGNDWQRYLSDPKRGVKADELKWTGLDDFLKERSGGRVTKQEISDFLKQNTVEVKEVELGKSGATKFGTYALPGGQNYRELLLTLPSANREARRVEVFDEYRNRVDAALESGDTDAHARLIASRHAEMSEWKAPRSSPSPSVRTGHFDEPNILAHVRFDERTDAEGRRVLHIAEVQSDWAQKGRREGFKGENWAADLNASPDAVPSAPFVGDTGQWSSLAMKRMIRYAAENGFDRVTWDTGETNAARYPSIDGKGMAGFYDQILPQVVNKIGKKWGAKVGETNVRAGYDIDRQKYTGPELTPDEVMSRASVASGADVTTAGDARYVAEMMRDSGADLRLAMETHGTSALARRLGGKMDAPPVDPKAHSIDITPEMKRSVLEEGQPLFKAGGKSVAEPQAPNAEAVRSKLREIFKGQKVEDAEGGGFVIKTPSGKKITVQPTGEISFGENLAQHGSEVQAAVESGERRIAGSMQTVGRDALVRIVDEGVLPHEIGGHVFLEHFADPREASFIQKEWTKRAESEGQGRSFDEVFADDYNQWWDGRQKPSTALARVFTRIRDFFERAKRAIGFESREGLFREIESSRPFDRPESRTIRPIPPGAKPGESLAVKKKAPEAEAPRYADRSGWTDEEKLLGYSFKVDPETQRLRDEAMARTSSIDEFDDFDPADFDLDRGNGPKYATAPATPPDVKAKPEPMGRPAKPEEAPRVESKVEALKEVAPGAELSRDEPRTWKSLDPEIRANVRKIEKDPMELARLYSRSKEGKVNDVDVMTLDAIVSGKQEQMVSAREAVTEAEKKGNATQEQVAYLKAVFDSSVADLAKAARNDVEAGTKLARAMAARNRIMNAVVLGDTTSVLRKILREIPDITDEQAGKLAEVLQNGSAADAQAALHASLKPSTLNKWIEGWKNGLVSAVGTQGGNIFGNVGEALTRIIETATAAAVDPLLGGPKTRLAGEAKFELEGSLKGGAESMGRLGQDLHDIFTLAPEKIDLLAPFERQTGAIGGKFGRGVRIPFRLLGAFDTFFKGVGQQAELSKLAYRLHKGDLAKAREMANTPHEKLPDSIRKAMMESAQGRTFQDPNEGAKSFGRLRNQFPILHLIAPFIETPLNIARITIQRSPYGFVEASKAYRAYRAAVSAGEGAETIARLKGEAVDKIARPLMGTAIIATFAAVAQSGAMTGSGPTDPKEANALKDGGWQPYSFVITGTDGKRTYIPFNRIEPVSSLLGFAADMVEAKSSKDKAALFDKAMGSIGQNLFSKTYLQGIAEAASAIHNPKQFADQYVSNLAGSIVPNIVSKVTQTIDPTLRDVRPGEGGTIERIGKTIVSRIPGASTLLPARRSGTGQTIQRPGNVATRLLSPVQVTGEKENLPFQEMLVATDAVPTAPRKEIRQGGKDVALTNEEFKALQDADEATTKQLQKLFRAPSFKQLPTERRKQLIDSRYNQGRSAARSRITSSPAFRKRLSAELRNP